MILIVLTTHNTIILGYHPSLAVYLLPSEVGRGLVNFKVPEVHTSIWNYLQKKNREFM